MAGRVRIFGVDSVRQRLERREDDLLAVFEQARVVDRHRGLGRQLRDQVAVVFGEHPTHLVIGQEHHTGRLAAQRDRDAQDGARVEWAVAVRLALHRLHEGLP